ncbi:MAG: N-acetylneuraminate synthase family protein [Proteobacteria bacterium]|nr:N-acetylneuraminate synthase family protein [Pseudomonadota bacterium]
MIKKKFEIAGRSVGTGEPVYIIAEVGSNHDGSIERAKELITAAKSTGADAVKFQSFTAEGLFNPMRPKDGANPDGEWEPHPAYPVIERLTLPAEWHGELKEFARNEGIDFLSAPFDTDRAVLLNELGVPAFKIASGEVTNEPLLRTVASFKKPVILSTGASYMSEVERAVEVMEEAGSGEIALLHCVALYPPRYDECNIRSVKTLAERFNCPVGLSDHTPGAMVPVAAVTLGASIVEKHITLDKSLDGPDHPYAMEVDEFAAMVTDIRNLEIALGSGVKEPSEGEMGERVGARRALYAAVDIKKGETIRAEQIKVVRHCYGLAPGELNATVGRSAKADIAKDRPLTSENV